MPWFSVRCVYRWKVDTSTYEERITLWQANSAQQAMALAEEEAEQYCSDTEAPKYLGFAQCYEIGEEFPGSGEEVFSLLRDSNLGEDDYISTFFDTGNEREGSV